MDEPPSPTIVEIRSLSHGRQRMLVLSDGREFLFSDDACERAGVVDGMPVSADVLKSLERGERRVNAHEAALRLLSSRARSESEMRSRLAMRGVDPPTIDAEIERLRSSGLLNDTKFAEAWVEDRKRVSPRGRRMVRYELLGRGIDPEEAERATDGIDDAFTALELARERARKSPAGSYETFVAKVGGFLRRRGFDYEVTALATRRVWEELAEEARAADERSSSEGE